MRQLTLTRFETSDHGTFGLLQGEGIELLTLELPWRDNKNTYSCIPAGEYVCAPYSSPKFKNVYEVKAVPGRKYVLIHSGNVAGDTVKGLRSDVEGCILVGLERGVLHSQKAVLRSREAMNLLLS